MLQPDVMKNSRRSVPYPGAGSRLYLPSSILIQTLEIIRSYGEEDSEGLVYWAGVVDVQGNLNVTALIIPGHPPQGDHVRPSRKVMRDLVRCLRRRDEKLLAQIHSHRFEAFHSFGDDQNATSYHEGFISVVVPYFGNNVDSLSECSIFEFRESFQSLSIQEVNNRFIVQDQSVELLPSSGGRERRSLWRELSRKLKSIVPKRLSRD